ncbi:MAG: DUF421 domain-containing protein [Chloroflexi bacterium]|nr:DUF421 domain-containing protein [Chloroflexota bacterium]MCL5074795.1 DUF421 domain-containing protein [Chloroflexota bacterium]
MLGLAAPFWEILLRTVIIYATLLVGLRVFGKRQLGQMTPFDLVVLLLIANAVQNAMTGPDTSVTGGVLAAATLLVVNYAVSALAVKSRPLEALIEGTPTILIKDGEMVQENIRREIVDEQELFAALREHGVTEIKEVSLAVLEIDGTISIVPASANVIRTKRRLRFLRHRG